MSGRTCPSCGNSIDPLRAPIARISGGKIVTFCSRDCADALSGLKPTAGPVAAASPTPRVAPTIAKPVAQPKTLGATPATPTPATEAPPVVKKLSAVETTPAVARLVVAKTPAAKTPVAAKTDFAPAPLTRAPLARPITSRTHGGRGKRVIVFVGIIALAGVSAVVFQMVSPSRPSPAAASSPPPAAPAAPAKEAQAPDPEALLQSAHTALTELLADPSPRVRLHAARALSRTGDKHALRELKGALQTDSSQIRRVEVAYALFRAGDTTGDKYLEHALDAKRRDVRLEAARSLARLGDDRGRERLHKALNVRTLKLEAAVTLAFLGDEEGISVLREALQEKGEENRMRAAAGLGKAGDATGLELLKQMVNDPRVELDAGGALATLGDKTCLPALQRALRLTGLRVEAAIATRRLGATIDLTVLAIPLEHGDELARITAAEAILVLLSKELPPELKKKDGL